MIDMVCRSTLVMSKPLKSTRNREGQDSMQIATPIHLRAGLSGHAYEAVRKLGHDKLRTSNQNGKATSTGLKLLLNTLKENIAAEMPVKTNELFFTAFYSPHMFGGGPRKACSSTSFEGNKTL